jgi:hypothetical protein
MCDCHSLDRLPRCTGPDGVDFGLTPFTDHSRNGSGNCTRARFGFGTRAG